MPSSEAHSGALRLPAIEALERLGPFSFDRASDGRGAPRCLCGRCRRGSGRAARRRRRARPRALSGRRPPRPAAGTGRATPPAALAAGRAGDGCRGGRRSLRSRSANVPCRAMTAPRSARGRPGPWRACSVVHLHSRGCRRGASRPTCSSSGIAATVTGSMSAKASTSGVLSSSDRTSSSPRMPTSSV
jgi:hypothetical protein